MIKGVSHPNFNQQAGQVILSQLDSLAERILSRQQEVCPKPALIYDETRVQASLNDIKHHLTTLSNSISQSDPNSFVEYLRWVQDLLEQAGCPLEEVQDLFRAFQEVVAEYVGRENIRAFFATQPGATLDSAHLHQPCIDATAPLGKLAQKFLDTLIAGDREVAIDLILDMVEDETTVQDIYMKVLQPVQLEVGRLVQADELGMADEHYVTSIVQTLMAQLYLYYPDVESKGKRVVAACPAGELHDIGLRMVSEFFEMEGWDAFFLGANTPKDAILNTLRTRAADVLALSISHPVLVAEVEAIIAAIRVDPELKHVKVLVGGTPFNAENQLWRDIGADGHARDAFEAVKTAKSVIEGKP